LPAELVALGGVAGRDVQVEGLQGLLAGVADLVSLTASNQQERPLPEIDPLTVHHRHALAVDDVEPLVGAMVAVVRPPLGLAGARVIWAACER